MQLKIYVRKRSLKSRKGTRNFNKLEQKYIVVSFVDFQTQNREQNNLQKSRISFLEQKCNFEDHRYFLDSE